jgi:hypothetical protein
MIGSSMPRDRHAPRYWRISAMEGFFMFGKGCSMQFNTEIWHAVWYRHPSEMGFFYVLIRWFTVGDEGGSKMKEYYGLRTVRCPGMEGLLLEKKYSKNYFWFSNRPADCYNKNRI